MIAAWLCWVTAFILLGADAAWDLPSAARFGLALVGLGVASSVCLVVQTGAEAVQAAYDVGREVGGEHGRAHLRPLRSSDSS
ncbi:MAG: hypothetical protein ACRDRL_29150 [Sciscionella sp.]